MNPKNILVLTLVSQKLTVLATWSSWGAWTTCTASCGPNGVRTRSRSCSPGNCYGDAAETVPCNGFGCPIDGGWGQWTPWSECCRGQETTRHRACSKPLPAFNGLDCSGDSTETDSCDTFCPIIMESVAHSISFYAIPSRIFTKACLTYWMGADWSYTSYILFDMQVTNMITTVVLMQITRNNAFERGTLEFDIHVGNATTTTTLATQGVMADLESRTDLTCDDVPLQRFHVGFIARYIKITATGRYGASAGLSYIAFE